MRYGEKLGNKTQNGLQRTKDSSWNPVWLQIGDQKMNGVRLMTTWAKALTDALT